MKKLFLLAIIVFLCQFLSAQNKFNANGISVKAVNPVTRVSPYLQMGFSQSGKKTIDRQKLLDYLKPNSKDNQNPIESQRYNPAIIPIYSQDFENYVNGDMTFIDNDGLIPDPMVSDIFGEISNWTVWEMNPGQHVAASTSLLVNGNQTADDWMITPPITINTGLQNPVCLIWDAKAQWSFIPDGYEVLISTTGTDFDDFTPLFQIDGENQEFTSRALNLTELGYSGQVYIAFHHNSTNMWNLYIDNISVREVSSDPDAAMVGLVSAPFGGFGQEMHIEGYFKNYSYSNLNSLKVNWTVNGNGPYSEDITNINLPFLEDEMFILTVPKEESGNTIQIEGINDVIVWVSEPNGSIDNFPLNDTLSINFELSPEYVYFMDFEDYIDGDMTMYDNDNIVPNGIPEWNNWVIWDDWDNFFAASLSFMAGGQVDQWMVTPPIEVGENNFLFWNERANADGMDEVLEILVSTTGNQIADFTSLLTIHENKGSWVSKAIDLSSYAGQNIYIAFRGRSNDQSYIGVDNIQIKPFTGLDLGVTEITIPGYIEVNEPFNVTGVLKNNLADAVTAFTLNYQFNGNDIVTQSFSNVAIYTFDEYAFTLADQAILTEIGDFDVKVWISEVNGIEDDNLHNDSLTAEGKVVPFMPQRSLLVEEATGTWCGWCPRGIVYLDSIHAVHPLDVIPVAVHNSDPMVNQVYDSGLFDNFMSAYPSTIIDRKIINDPQAVFDDYDKYIDDFGFAELTIDVVANPVSRSFTANISATFATSLVGDYRFACVLTENNVHMDNPAYDQDNYYAGGMEGPMGGFENLPDPVPASQMYYDFVAREILGGFAGQANSLPSTIEISSVHEYSFNYTVPSAFNMMEMNAVALLIDNQTGEIMNAKDSDRILVGVFDKPTTANIKVYPNPANDVINVGNIAGADLKMVDLLGKVVYSAINIAENHLIDVSRFEPGMYFIIALDGDKEEAIKVIVE